MSRVILSKHAARDGQTDDERDQHVVVGWDRPLATYYWQEFNPEKHDNGEYYTEEVRRYAGYVPNELPNMQALLDSIPANFKHWLTEDVQRQLDGTVNENTGQTILDLTPTSFKIEVSVLGEAEDKWSTNALRFSSYGEAEFEAKALASRWMMVRTYRITPSDDPVNYKIDNGKVVPV